MDKWINRIIAVMIALALIGFIGRAMLLSGWKGTVRPSSGNLLRIGMPGSETEARVLIVPNASRYRPGTEVSILEFGDLTIITPLSLTNSTEDTRP